MAVIDMLSLQEIRDRYTHLGWFCGLCPVYIGRLDSPAPHIDARNGVPEWWFDVVAGLFGAFCEVAMLINPEFEPSFPVMITGEIDRGPL